MSIYNDTEANLYIGGKDFDLAMSIEYDYQPPEAPTLDYAGAYEDIEITNVYIGGTDITDEISDLELNDMADSLLELLRDMDKDYD